jgi:hypothetical protein
LIVRILFLHRAMPNYETGIHHQCDVMADYCWFFALNMKFVVISDQGTAFSLEFEEQIANQVHVPLHSPPPIARARDIDLRQKRSGHGRRKPTPARLLGSDRVVPLRVSCGWIVLKKSVAAQ